MPLKPGAHLGQYEILGLLGAGGMGEVYRARDPKLEREVALKVLPEAFSRSPERLARFRREAQLLASLNHTNIAHIYGLEASDGLNYLVMELAPGSTLAERVLSGPLEIDEALRLCAQIAEGLEHAHEKGIIHRDLKPANVKVTPEGKVKILDFGLAKAMAPEPAEEIYDPAAPTAPTAPTRRPDATIPGTIMGTPAYMSPEQARGTKNVDRRTDIWAFGCVLYEMLTAKRAFPGETTTDIIAGILKGEPDWTALPPATPKSIRVLLRRCLEKDAKRRFHSAADVQIQIEEALASPATTSQSTLTPIKSWRRALLWSITSAVVAALLAGAAIWNLRTPGQRPIVRSAITLPPNVTPSNLDSPAVAISPDGSHLAYAATRGGTTQLFLRALDSLETKAIDGTEGAEMPFFSPDGQWLGFFSGNKLKKVSIAGGASVTLCDVPNQFAGASWGANDMIVFGVAGFASAMATSGLQWVPAAGGRPQTLAKLDPAKGEFDHLWPQLLPGGKAVLFTVQTLGSNSDPDEATIALQQLPTGQRKVLVQGGTYGRYLTTGHLIYIRNGTLMAAPFDLKRLELTGPAVPLLEGVTETFASAGGAGGGAQLSISDQGSLIYIPGSARGAERTLVWVDRKGTEQPLAAPPRSYLFPRLSPDGRLLVADIESDIWVYDIPRGTLSRLTFDGKSSFPILAPDGRRVAFNSAKEGKPPNLFWKPSDGSGPEERLTTSDHTQYSMSWSLDGQFIAFTDNDPTTGLDIWVLPLSGERRPRLFLRTPFNESGPKFSPDGRWLAYVSNESGRYEIYVQSFPGPGGKWQISTDGGIEPLWARNGELFYRNGNRMMAVETKAQPIFSAGAPQVLFEGPYFLVGPGVPNYAVAADGQRFVMLKSSGQEAAPTQINVVLNWFEELKRKVPVK